MASGHGGFDPCGDVGRSDDVRAHWGDAGVEPRQARSDDRATAQGREGLQNREMKGPT